MMLQCAADGNWHDLSTVRMIIVIDCFANGELQTVTKEGIKSECFMSVFTPEKLDEYQRRYPGRKV